MDGKVMLPAILAGLGGLLIGAFWGSSMRDDSPRATNDGPSALLVLHGGAGVLDDDDMKAAGTKTADYEQALADALRAGFVALRSGTCVDGVEKAIRAMEDSRLFNAGRGAAINRDGQARLDAAIMEGRMTPVDGPPRGKRDPRKRAGAVADVAHISNPISAARAVMEMPDGRAVLLVGDGAERFALSDEMLKRYDLRRVSNDHFHTPWRLKLHRDGLEREKKKAQLHHEPRSDFGTVGAVACKDGTLAAGTSTGGLTNKLSGRVGDTPLIGAGTYADDRACAVSCTGTGEVFIRHAVAHDVVTRMMYGRLPLVDAAQQAIDAVPDEEGGVGSLIALTAEGRFTFALSRQLPGTYRGYVTASGELYVGTLKGEMKAMGKVEAK